LSFTTKWKKKKNHSYLREIVLVENKAEAVGALRLDADNPDVALGGVEDAAGVVGVDRDGDGGSKLDRKEGEKK